MGQTASQVAAPKHSLEGDELCTCTYTPPPPEPDYEDLIQLRRAIRRTLIERIRQPTNQNQRELRRTIDILGALGSGGFGSVALIFDRITGTLGALKCVEKAKMSRSGTREKMERELTYVLGSSFSIILKAHSESPNYLRYLLEFMGGSPLGRVMRSRPRWDEKSAKFFLAQIALALDHLQDLDIIHYDIKPNNILVDMRGYVKLCDYGLSAVVLGNKRDCLVKGTRKYMAPEVAIGEMRSGLGADVYSYGVLVYEFLHGYLPWGDKAKIVMNMRNRPDPEFAPRVSKEAQDFTLGLMNCDQYARLGCQAEGFIAVLNHQFFNDVNFVTLYKQEYSCPADIVPIKLGENYPIKLYDDPSTGPESF